MRLRLLLGRLSGSLASTAALRGADPKRKCGLGRPPARGAQMCVRAKGGD